MISRIGSDRESFKALTFGPGLNILLADKSEGATDRQSRNGAGKTSLVELVHFLFGANAPSTSIFKSEALCDWTFEVEVEVGKDVIRAARSGRRPSHITIGGRFADQASFRQANLVSGLQEVSNEDWKSVLGKHWFDLRSTADESAPFQPSFRSLFSFVARRQENAGFQQPMQHSAKQQLWDQQVSISYLLGLDWAISQRFQDLRKREKGAKELRRAARGGELGRHIGRAADLRTQLTVSAARTVRLRERLDNFRIVPQYKELESEADEITGRINDLHTENLVDRALVRELATSLEDEDAPGFRDLEKLYAEAGVVLPELTLRRLDQVELFHHAVIENRRSHLNVEIDSANERIEVRDHQKEALDERRRQIMGILGSGGALDHYTALREELGRSEAESETLKQRLDISERLESAQAELDVERAKLTKALREDIHEREYIVREAILKFENLSESLYERAGSLTIADTKNGPLVEVHIDAERSKGITNMQIFCFDLMLTEMQMSRGRFPGFLIHDSHLFDGVDERQVAKALQLGAERAESAGFQYIVMMNSDAVPTEGFKAGFDIAKYFTDVRLTDATETGGLFGFRFG